VSHPAPWSFLKGAASSTAPFAILLTLARGNRTKELRRNPLSATLRDSPSPLRLRPPSCRGEQPRVPIYLPTPPFSCLVVFRAIAMTTGKFLSPSAMASAASGLLRPGFAPHRGHRRPRVTPVPSVHRTVDRRALTDHSGELLVACHGGPPRRLFLRRPRLLSLPLIISPPSDLRSTAQDG
jgi:hypothetical protein